MHTPRITFIDPDTVEKKNVGRQMFTLADLGQNKAELLMRRLNLALGLDITAIPEPFDPDRHPNGNGTLLIGCVDNHEARRALAQATGFWIDCGNHFESGQVVAGNCGTGTQCWTVSRRWPNAAGRHTTCLTPHSSSQNCWSRPKRKRPHWNARARI